MTKSCWSAGKGDDEITFEFLADKFASVHTEINLMAGSMNEIHHI